MFRRIEDSLEKDPSFAADLKELGFFVNNVGHIRMIDAPDKQYVFHSTNNERINERLREAMQTCQREESEKRLSYLGLNCLHLPEFAVTKPKGPHIPILAPSPETLKTRKRVIVLVNDSTQDLGILAYRQLQRVLGINGGSVVNFVKEIIKRSSTVTTAQTDEDIFTDGFKLEDDSNTPALVVLNTGQLLYSHMSNRAMTLRSWSAMPRKSITHDMVRIHEEENRVKGHRSAKEHVKTVFDEVICNPERVAPEAEVYVIAIEGGTANVLDLLTEDFEEYGSRITAMALVHSLIDDSQIKVPKIRAFLHQRVRQWKYTDLTSNPLHCTDLPEDYEEHLKSHPLPNTPSVMKSAEHISWYDDLPKPEPLSVIAKALHRLAFTASALKEDPAPTVPDTSDVWASGQTVICPTFAGGEISEGECVFTDPSVQNAILTFFEEVAQDPENYRNPAHKIYTEAPRPTPDSPLAFSTDETDVNFPTVAPEMTPEQAELDVARDMLAEMRVALSACPTNVPELEKGRERLVKKIQNMEVAIGDLEKAALGHGGLRAGEAQDKRENWKPQTEGPKVPFAGTMVDSELLKAAGLVETAKKKLKELGGGGGEADEEKAFI
ncbi:hypothetical protein EJ02DRAFT_136032 [Clathrospora elynae]|uniref:Arb2 domain-containing protein n=1 Tax=Clathrospora elynae TaxID=706981 RepID=A0A6A5T2G0_9PLEO|nr:hypothetical protein EJ02DRAFT_136032 [Clathrospora elynae]